MSPTAPLRGDQDASRRPPTRVLRECFPGWDSTGREGPEPRPTSRGTTPIRRTASLQKPTVRRQRVYSKLALTTGQIPSGSTRP
ncbi:unnamed protein product, partial [Trichogramma brassicae]